jgi:hypothetical protein
MYTPIEEDDVALLGWKESMYKGTQVYIGLINHFVVAVCTQHLGMEYDALAIRFRLRNYGTRSIGGIYKTESRGVIAIYRHGWDLNDLKMGLWLTPEELDRINTAIEKALDDKKLEFVKVK